jgi:hypothetical protein
LIFFCNSTIGTENSDFWPEKLISVQKKGRERIETMRIEATQSDESIVTEHPV